MLVFPDTRTTPTIVRLSSPTSRGPVPQTTITPVSPSWQDYVSLFLLPRTQDIDPATPSALGFAEAPLNSPCLPTTLALARWWIDTYDYTGSLEGKPFNGTKTRSYHIKTPPSGGGRICSNTNNTLQSQTCAMYFGVHGTFVNATLAAAALAATKLTSTSSAIGTTSGGGSSSSCTAAENGTHPDLINCYPNSIDPTCKSAKYVCGSDFETYVDACAAEPWTPLIWPSAQCNSIYSELLQAGAARSWTVIPRFQDPVVRLTGRKRGAGVKTRLEFEFSTLSPANQVYLFSTPRLMFEDVSAVIIETKERTSFGHAADWGEKVLRQPMSPDALKVAPYDPLVAGVLAITSLTLAGNMTRTRITLVDLVFPPGTIRFNYHMRSYHADTGYAIRDEIRFKEFDLPGQIEFRNFVVRGLWWQKPQASIKSQYALARAGQIARVQLDFAVVNPGTTFFELQGSEDIRISPVDVCLITNPSKVGEKIVPLKDVYTFRAESQSGEVSNEILHVQVGERRITGSVLEELEKSSLTAGGLLGGSTSGTSEGPLSTSEKLHKLILDHSLVVNVEQMGKFGTLAPNPDAAAFEGTAYEAQLRGQITTSTTTTTVTEGSSFATTVGAGGLLLDAG